ncbi:MECDP-synthase [Marinobacter sp. SS13-12]|uniref:MECDP-synthase n=1 Tax=Marinobacter sp. SS13-12 TaxID=3050451 RepID=UPI0025574A27|nr:MECDP-synthase [Marinobacter sp. SS13-12]MDK8464938.1 MECDP-synthase [Marinobacter sp. SS13-12]
MFKKTLISLAVASSLGLTGCFDSAGSGSKNANPDYKITDTTIDQSLVRPIFDPILTSPDFDIPANFDLVLLLGAGQSANYDFTGFTTGTDPASDTINDLDGFSTSGQINVRFNGSLKASTVVAGQTVHLVPINMLPVSANTPSIELTANPSYIDTSDPFDLTKLATQDFRTEVISLDGGSDNVIRITPLKPLEDQTKYLVIVTDGVKGADGQSTAPSVPYSEMAGDGPLGNAAFQTIRDVIQGGQGLAEAWLAANSIDSDVTLAYTLTTTNTKTSLHAITSPATFLTQLGEEVVLYSALQVVRDNLPAGSTASKVFAALADALSAEPENLELAQKVGAAVAPYQTDPNLGPQVVGSAIPGLPYPQPRTSAFYSDTTRTADTLAAVQASGNAQLQSAASLVNVTEGAIELPYYAELPGTDGSGLVEGMWRGSTTLETTLNATIDAFRDSGDPQYASLSNFEFPRDTDGTLNLTQYMPFPQENAKVAVPVTVFYPNTGSGCTSIDDVIIFQHGITVDRSVATIPAITVAAQASPAANIGDATDPGQCIATVAIDQPLHGLGGSPAGTVPGLNPLGAYVNEADFPNADFVGERHFNYTAIPGTLTPEQQADIADVESGSLAINVGSLQTTRDTLRQGVVDLLNLAATIKSGNFDIDGDGDATYGDTSLQGANFHFVGHSLGGITGTTFASLVENATLRGAYAAIPIDASYPNLSSISLMNTGSQLSKLAENSPAFSGAILGGLSAATGGTVVQGTSSLETFLYVWQSAVDTTDPVSYSQSLGASVAAEGSTSILVSEVVGDLTVPNEANVAPFGQALSAPLAGTEPLMALINLGAGVDPLTSGSLISASNPTPVASVANAASFFFGAQPCSTANHGTFVAPATPADPDDQVCPEGSSTGDAFNEMAAEVIGNIRSQAIPVVNSSVLGDSPTVDSALDQDQ